MRHMKHVKHMVDGNNFVRKIARHDEGHLQSSLCQSRRAAVEKRGTARECARSFAGLCQTDEMGGFPDAGRCFDRRLGFGVVAGAP